MIKQLVIFGATGDLTSRKLLPAVAELYEARLLPDHFSVLGAARQNWNIERFRRHIREGLEQHAPGLSTSSRDAVLSMLDYRVADVTDKSRVTAALRSLDQPVVVYLALPPRLFAATLESLDRSVLKENSRVVIEKPFGEDLASAQQLNRLLHEKFPEGAVFRIDHFLHKQTVQNMLGLRFANRVFEDIWNRNHIQRVEIIWDETLALEGRASYYDHTGALKDMIQNHLLQLLCLMAMEPPLALNEHDLRDRKADVLRAVRRLSAQEVQDLTVRGRYTAGRVQDRDIPAYIESAGVDPSRQTETFAQVTLAIDNWRWAGVPFMLRTGKALARDHREIAVHFRSAPHLAFAGANPPANVLRLQVAPDRVSLGININGPGDPFDLEHVELDRQFPQQTLPAYSRLLLDVLEGDCTLSIRADEAEEAWRIVEPILAAWKSNAVPLQDYPAGSGGPN